MLSWRRLPVVGPPLCVYRFWARVSSVRTPYVAGSGTVRHRFGYRQSSVRPDAFVFGSGGPTRPSGRRGLILVLLVVGHSPGSVQVIQPALELDPVEAVIAVAVEASGRLVVG